MGRVCRPYAAKGSLPEDMCQTTVETTVDTTTVGITVKTTVETPVEITVETTAVETTVGRAAYRLLKKTTHSIFYPPFIP